MEIQAQKPETRDFNLNFCCCFALFMDSLSLLYFSGSGDLNNEHVVTAAKESHKVTLWLKSRWPLFD